MIEAQRLACELDAVPENGADPQLIEEAAAELRRLEAECEQLKKANALLQQHHATAWNRGHEMGMMANRQIASEALKAVASDAWDNTRMTEALMASEAECEQLRNALKQLVIATKHLGPCPGTLDIAERLLKETK